MIIRACIKYARELWIREEQDELRKEKKFKSIYASLKLFEKSVF